MKKQGRPTIQFTFSSLMQGENVELTAANIVNAIAMELPSVKGLQLPPVRVLAHKLGVSKTTIQNAYDELKARGLIESRPRQGLFVVAPLTSSPKVKTPPLASLGAIRTLTIPHSLMINVRAQEKGDEGIGGGKHLHLSRVFIDPALLPKKQVERCLHSVLKLPGLPEYHEPQGFLPLRKYISTLLEGRGISAPPEHILITNGSQQALDLFTRILNKRVVGTENPCYQLGKALFDLNHVQVIGLPVNPWENSSEAKEQSQMAHWRQLIEQHRPEWLYLTPNFQNPTGHSYSTQQMQEILSLSQEFQMGILEDDWSSEMLSYSEFRLGLRALGGENVLYMNSFTKKLLPSLRVGYLVANEKLLPSLLYAKTLSSLGGPALMELALFEFLDRGYYQVHLQKLQKALDARYQHCLALLKKEITPLSPDIKHTFPGGGPVIWLNLPLRVSIQELAQKLQARGVIIDPLENAFMDAVHSAHEKNLHGFPIGYAFLSEEKMEKAIKILAEILALMLARK